MKKILVCVILLSSFLFASDVDLEKEKRTKAAIEKAIEKEKLYAREKVFYDENSYDFKDSEVNEESLKTLKAKEVDDLDMDDVYD
jgi:hypothetical protein